MQCGRTARDLVCIFANKLLKRIEGMIEVSDSLTTLVEPYFRSGCDELLKAKCGCCQTKLLETSGPTF